MGGCCWCCWLGCFMMMMMGGRDFAGQSRHDGAYLSVFSRFFSFLVWGGGWWEGIESRRSYRSRSSSPPLEQKQRRPPPPLTLATHSSHSFLKKKEAQSHKYRPFFFLYLWITEFKFVISSARVIGKLTFLGRLKFFDRNHLHFWHIFNSK